MTDLRELRALIVKSTLKSREGHIPSGLSILDIVWVLYDKILKISPDDAKNPGRDRFFLSKGHGSLGLYAVLSQKGFFKKEEFDRFSMFDSILGGHPDRNKVPGVEASTGSLGHGFPMSIGAALGLRIQKIPARVYVLIGDGECNEGTVWESAMLASHHRLDNLCCIIDHNHSSDRALIVDDLVEKFAAFGWETISVNGHDHKELEAALRRRPVKRPYAIIARTIKGHGVPSLENDPAWHHRAPTEEELENLIKEIYASA